MEEDLIDFNIENAEANILNCTIQAEPRRLNVRWTREVEEDLRQYIDVDLERTLVESARDYMNAALGIPEKFLYSSSWTHDYLSRTKKIRQMEVE